MDLITDCFSNKREKKMKSKFFIVLVAIFILTGFYSGAGAADINVGALNDMTGATSDVGKDYALGIAEASCISLITATGCLKPSPNTNCLNG